MQKYSIFPKASWLVPYHQRQFNAIPRTFIAITLRSTFPIVVVFVRVLSMGQIELLREQTLDKNRFLATCKGRCRHLHVLPTSNCNHWDADLILNHLSQGKRGVHKQLVNPCASLKKIYQLPPWNMYSNKENYWYWLDVSQDEKIQGTNNPQPSNMEYKNNAGQIQLKQTWKEKHHNI